MSRSSALEVRIAELEAALAEANETLDAIRNGEVDAVVVGSPQGQIVYTLENADRPYRVLVEQMREGAVTLSADGTVLYCNQSFAGLVGERMQDIVGRSVFSLIEDRAELERMLAKGSGGRSKEMVVRAVDGRAVPTNVSIVELDVPEGDLRILCGIVTDLTQNYDRARDLAESNARLQAEIADRTRAEQSLTIALDAADMGSWDLGLGYQTVVRTPRHDAIFGYSPPLAKWTLSLALEHFVAEDQEDVRASYIEAEKTGRLDFEKRIRRASDGALRWVHVIGRTFPGQKGAERIAGVISDVTDRRLIDEQLRQGQKMEAIGQLTGGIAHDFNNLLMIIGGSLESLSRRVTLDDRVQRLLDAARMGVARGAKLNEQLLAFARRQDMREESICLTDLLPTFETLLDRAVGETVDVDVQSALELWSCKADPHQLETAILNLAINGRDAMEGAGRIALTTENVPLTSAQAKGFEASPGDYVKISVSDTGCGMNAEVAARVFEPFFTTKGVGQGTGLGLSQVYGFAKQSGGFVSLQSVEGEGTTVSIYLPRSAPSVAAPVIVHAAPAGDAIGTVLLVEDDADVREATSAMLDELGYTVREASSGPEALQVLKAARDIDVVFTDVIMASGMSGVELARAVKAERPDLPVLLTSGYTAQRMVPNAMNGDLPLLRKPYTLAELAAGLSGVLT